ncbi:MAG: M23 family metallopeptidase [Pseudomonadota bacterium]
MIQDTLFGLFMVWASLWPGAGAEAEGAGLKCGGALSQGGLIVCTAQPGTVAMHGSVDVEVGEDGLAVFGIARDAPPIAEISARRGEAQFASRLDIAPRQDAFRVIEGLDCDRVDARTDAQKARAGESWVLKQAAFATFHRGDDWTLGFSRPAAGPSSSPFGPARRYIGVSAVTGEPCDRVSVHRGYDIATPVGTELIAPAGGTVTLADLDLYYEGGTIFLDHGHGLVSVFLHLSAIDVAVGQRVERGQRLGETGNTGRTTGPHLHWAVKWRDISRQDRAGDFYIDPALLLEMDLTALLAAQSENRFRR